MEYIDLRPETQCDGNPHTCGMDPVFQPKTPNLDKFNAEGGSARHSDLRELMEWLMHEDYADFSEHPEVLAYKYMEVDGAKVSEESNMLIEACMAAARYADFHGIPGLLGSFASEETTP